MSSSDRARQELRPESLNRSCHSWNAANEDAKATLRWCLSDERMRDETFSRVVRGLGRNHIDANESLDKWDTKRERNSHCHCEHSVSREKSILKLWRWRRSNEMLRLRTSFRDLDVSSTRSLKIPEQRRCIVVAKWNVWDRLRSFEWSRSIVDEISVFIEDQIDVFRIQTTSIVCHETSKSTIDERLLEKNESFRIFQHENNRRWKYDVERNHCFSRIFHESHQLIIHPERSSSRKFTRRRTSFSR